MVSLPRRLWASCNSPQNTRVILTILFPESLLSRFLRCPVQGFPDQSIILCDPGQWPLDLPSSQETKNASIVVGASEKGGFEGYIVLYQQRPLTALDAYFATSFCISLSIVLALLDLCPSRKACRCLKCFLAGPCPMEMPVPVQRTTMPARLLIRYLLFKT